MDEKKTSLYDVHVKYGGKMVPFAEYLLPVQYEGYGVIREHMAVRRDCGLFDVSHMGEILCEGEGALDNLNYLLTNDFTNMRDGQARYSPMCNENGGVVDDLIVYKFRDNHYFIRVTARREVFWINPYRVSFAKAQERLDFTMADIEEAQARLLRFAPFLAGCFPELQKTGGIIESPLQDIPAMAESLWDGCGAGEGEPLRHGRMLMKQDSELAVAGSVKARGGIHEVLAATEELALKAGILKETDDYSVLLKHRDFFSRYTMQVGSTGNLGLSIGIMSAAIG